MSYIPITIQRLDTLTENWSDMLSVHAIQVNKRAESESFSAGAEQYHPRLTFTLRWSQALEAVAYATQTHRIIYRGRSYNIVDYDDYMERRLIVNIVGEAYG